MEPSNPVVKKFVERCSNSAWGAMRTKWRFELEGERILRFETGQA